MRMLRSAVLVAMLALAGPPAAVATGDDGYRQALFAGGCFWCMQPPYDELDGVIDTEVGFAGGDVADPTYDEVTDGGTGHREVVRVTWDPDKTDYDALLRVFWRNVDPLDDGGQFCDRGHQYTTAIFALDEAQRAAATASVEALEASGRFDEPVVTPVLEAAPFYPADASHQDYYRDNPLRYRAYRLGCGRDLRLTELWDEP